MQNINHPINYDHFVTYLWNRDREREDAGKRKQFMRMHSHGNNDLRTR